MAETEQKREKEKKLIACMIHIYCRGNHSCKKDELCKECSDLLEYAQMRVKKCPLMETKTFCSSCKIHCYSPKRQAEIKKVMGYAGPRILRYHPVMAISHMVETMKMKRKNK